MLHAGRARLRDNSRSNRFGRTARQNFAFVANSVRLTLQDRREKIICSQIRAPNKRFGGIRQLHGNVFAVLASRHGFDSPAIRRASTLAEDPLLLGSWRGLGFPGGA